MSKPAGDWEAQRPGGGFLTLWAPAFATAGMDTTESVLLRPALQSLACAILRPLQNQEFPGESQNRSEVGLKLFRTLRRSIVFLFLRFSSLKLLRRRTVILA